MAGRVAPRAGTVFGTWIGGNGIGCGMHATAALAHLVRRIANEAGPGATADGGPRMRSDISLGLGLEVRFDRRLVQSDWKERRLATGRDKEDEENNGLRLQIVQSHTEINDANNFACALDCYVVGKGRYSPSDKRARATGTETYRRPIVFDYFGRRSGVDSHSGRGSNTERGSRLEAIATVITRLGNR